MLISVQFCITISIPHIAAQMCCCYMSVDLQHTLQTPPVSLDCSQNFAQDLLHLLPPPHEQQEPHTPLQNQVCC